MDIGTKIKEARIAAQLTQEQVAQALGVSRQTMSNWENNKTYPDIVSVIKMSDLYAVSLDYLLKEKEEQPVSNYMEYLEESTNTVKSRTRLAKMILITACLGIWSFSIIVFWFFISGSDAMAFSLMFLWIVLPVTTFAASLLIGRNDYWAKWKWMAALIFGILYMLAEYATFDAANMAASAGINMPHFEMLGTGAVISAIGLGIGTFVSRKKSDR